MNTPPRAASLCHAEPNSLSSARSPRVRARHNVHKAILTELLAAVNVLGQAGSVNSVPFSVVPTQSAATNRDADFCSARVRRFTRACRSSGGSGPRPSRLAAFLPSLSRGEFLSSPAMSRTAAAHTDNTAAPSSACDAATAAGHFGDYKGAFDAHAQAAPVDADLVSLPADAGNCRLMRFLERRLSHYSDPANLLRKEPPSFPAHSVFLVREGHYPRLLRRLLDIKLIALQTKRPLVVNGLFAVPKPDGTQRLIVDARPANALFVDPEPVQLTTGEAWANLSAQPGVALSAGKLDVDNFYHRLEMPEQYWQYFGLPAVSPAALGLAEQFTGVEQLWPVIKTLPMGFAHAVLLAQSFNIGFVQQCVPELLLSDMVAPSNDRRINRARWSIYIDDLSILGPDAARINALLEAYRRAAHEHGLFIKPAKFFGAAQDGIDVTGLRLDGAAATIGVAPDKLVALSEQTLAIARAPIVRQRDLAVVLGKWVWAMMVQRPSLAVFGAVYQWSQLFRDSSGPLWPSARLELALAVALAPLLVADLSAGWFHETVAFDASSTALGVVASQVPQMLVDNLVDHVGKPRLHALRSDDIIDSAARTAMASVPLPSPASLEAVGSLASQPWRTIFSHRWRRPEHINALEATSLRTAIRWVHSHPSAVNSRILLLSDSAVVVFATTKGRSSSRLLLANLRRTAAYVLSAGLRPVLRWIPSHLNPADAPSRPD